MRKWKGSITLEASYIFPMTIIFIIVILLFAYYKHDRILVRTSMRRHLMKNAYEEEKSNFTVEDIGNLHYLSVSEIKENHEKNVEKLSLKVDFDVFPKFLSLEGRQKEGEVTEEYRRYQPQVVARRYQVLFGK